MTKQQLLAIYGNLDPAILHSIYLQHCIFSAYQRPLVAFLNSEEGKYYLQKKLGFTTDFPLIFVNRNTLIEDTKERDGKAHIYRANFYSGQPLTSVFLPLLEKVSLLKAAYMPTIDYQEAFAFYANLRTKSQYTQIYPEEIQQFHGFNPLLYKFLLEHPQFLHLSSNFSPHSGSTSPVDGIVARGSVNEAFATIQAGVGNYFTNVGSSVAASPADQGVILVASATSNQFARLARTIMCFDTSTLGALVTVTAVTMQLYYWTVYNGEGNPDAHIAGATPAATNTLANSDYGNVGATSYGSINRASITTGAYNNFSLNASGIANINQTGISKYSSRSSWDITNSFGGAWVNGDNSRLDFNSADDASNPPVLAVTYTVPGGILAAEI